MLAAGGLWFGRNTWRKTTADKTSTGAALESAAGQTETAQMLNGDVRLAPPGPAKKFRDFTPEQRVEFARKGHGPGG